MCLILKSIVPSVSGIPWVDSDGKYFLTTDCHWYGDDCGFTFYSDYVESPLDPNLNDDEEVDVILMPFFMNDFIQAVRELDPLSTIEYGDFKPYAEGMVINQVWGAYAVEVWN